MNNIYYHTRVIMKKISNIVVIISIMSLLIVACGNKTVSEEESVSIDYKEAGKVNEISKEITSSEEVVNEVTTDVETLEDTNKSYYVSEREVCEYKDDFPEGVCADFSYFFYGGNIDAPLQAQKYLEEIGVSEENRKLIVRMADEDGEDPTHLVFLEFVFDKDGTKRREHYFFSNEVTYEESISDIDSIDEKSDVAFYIRTDYYDASSISYDRVIQMGEDSGGLYDILW